LMPCGEEISKPEPRFIFFVVWGKKSHFPFVQFHQLQISLYADFDYPKLMNFLRTAKTTKPEVALEVCRSRNLYPEMV